MAVTTNSTVYVDVDQAAREYIEAESIEYAYQQMCIRNVLKAANPSTIKDFSGPGAKLDIVQRDKLTFGAVTEGDEANALEEYITTQRQLIPIMMGTQLFVSWQAENLPEQKTSDEIAKEIGTAYAQFLDGNTTYGFPANYTEAATANEFGADGVAMDVALVRQGWTKLMAQKARGPYNLFIDPIQVGELYQDLLFESAMRQPGSQTPVGFSSTAGLPMQYFIGNLFRTVNIWVNVAGMIESSGLFAMMCGASALGMAYKNISTPESPTPSEINVDQGWKRISRGFEIAITTCVDTGGLVDTSTTNRFMAALVS